MVRLLPSPSNRLHKIRLRDLLPAREVARSDLGVDLDARVGWDEVLWDIVPFQNRDAGFYYSVVFPVRPNFIVSYC